MAGPTARITVRQGVAAILLCAGAAGLGMAFERMVLERLWPQPLAVAELPSFVDTRQRDDLGRALVWPILVAPAAELARVTGAPTLLAGPLPATTDDAQQRAFMQFRPFIGDAAQSVLNAASGPAQPAPMLSFEALTPPEAPAPVNRSLPTD